MKTFFTILLALFFTVGYGQTSVNGYIGMDMITYKFKNVSDPYLNAAINIMDVSNGLIKEGTFGYSRLNDTKNIYAGIYIGKKYNKTLIRGGFRTIGLLDTKSATDVHLCLLAGYEINKSLILNIDYAWLPTNTALHAFGINALVRLYNE